MDGVHGPDREAVEHGHDPEAAARGEEAERIGGDAVLEQQGQPDLPDGHGEG